MKITKKERKEFRLKFNKELSRQKKSMEVYDNSGFSDTDIERQRAQANEEFSALAKINIKKQAKAYQKIKNFRIV